MLKIFQAAGLSALLGVLKGTKETSDANSSSISALQGDLIGLSQRVVDSLTEMDIAVDELDNDKLDKAEFAVLQKELAMGQVSAELTTQDIDALLTGENVPLMAWKNLDVQVLFQKLYGEICSLKNELAETQNELAAAKSEHKKLLEAR